MNAFLDFGETMKNASLLPIVHALLYWKVLFTETVVVSDT